MDVVRLGPLGNTRYRPDALVEGYSSMIWTERQQTPGDFQLVTPLVDETLSLLPEGCFISHLETDEVAMVENRTIQINEKGEAELKVVGRTLDFFPEHRHVEGPYNKNRTMIRKYRPVGAVAVLLWNAFDNATGVDHTRLGQKSQTDKDKLPNVAIVDSVPTDVGNQRRWRLKEGPLYPQLQDILVRGDLGLRAIRPITSGKKVVSVGNDWLTVTTHSGGVEVSSQQMEGGSITRTLTDDINALIFEIYSGRDLTSTVVLDVDEGVFDKVQYLFSNQIYKTSMEVMSSTPVSDVTRNATEAAYSGWDRRVASMDAGDPELPDEPEKPDRPDEPKQNAPQSEWDTWHKDMDDWRDEMDKWRPKHADWIADRDKALDEFKEDATDDALKQLKKMKRMSVVSGDISPFAKFKYKVDYDLGDTVLLKGNYKQTQKLVVSEYTRTEDASGDRGFPGLVLP